MHNIKLNVSKVKLEGDQAAVQIQQPDFDALGNIIKSAMDGLGNRMETSVTGLQNEHTNPKVKSRISTLKVKICMTTIMNLWICLKIMSNTYKRDQDN